MDTVTTKATTTMDHDAEQVKEEETRVTNWGGSKRNKRRRSQRNRSASCSSDKQRQFVGHDGATRRQPKRHILQRAEDNGSNGSAKVWQYGQQKQQHQQVKTMCEGIAVGGTECSGTMAGGRTQTSGFPARHQTQQLQSRSTLKPRAPNNTTSFLMSDLEKRQQHGEDDQQHDMSALADIARLPWGQKMMAKKVGPSSANGELTSTMMDSRHELAEDDGTDIEEQRDADFQECLFSTSIERIERLSREEVNRELLFADRDNRMLKHRMALLRESYQKMQEENQKLKTILKGSGAIPCDERKQ